MMCEREQSLPMAQINSPCRQMKVLCWAAAVLRLTMKLEHRKKGLGCASHRKKKERNVEKQALKSISCLFFLTTSLKNPFFFFFFSLVEFDFYYF